MTHPPTIAAQLPLGKFERLESSSLDPCLNALEADAHQSTSLPELLTKMLQHIARYGIAGITLYRHENPSTTLTQWSSDGQPNIETSILEGTLCSGKPKIIEVDSRIASSNIHSVVLAPFDSAGNTSLLALGCKQPISELHLTDYFPLLAALTEIITSAELRFKQKTLEHQLDQQQKLLEYNQLVHQHLELQSTGYTIANELRRLIACDRVSLVIRRGRRYHPLSVSGAEHIHRHSPAASQLQRLCETIAAVREPLWYPLDREKLPPQLSEAIDEYLDLSPAIDLAVVPLTDNQAETEELPIGVLVLENYQDNVHRLLAERVQPFVASTRTALVHAAEVSAIPAHQWWIRLSRRAWIERWGLRLLLSVVVLLGILGALLFVPADIQVRATGELQPVERREVFAPRDAVVAEIFVQNGDPVKAGTPLLELRSTELNLLQQQVDGELDTTRKKLAATQSERLQIKLADSESRLRERRLTAEEDQLAQQVRALEGRQAMLREEYEKLKVAAPISGEVLTWNTQERLATRPVRRGESLLLVADVTGDWEILAKIPSRKIGRFLLSHKDLANLKEEKVEVILSSQPGRKLTGTLQHIGSRVELDDAGVPHLLVRVGLQQDSEIPFVAGNSAVVRFECGRGPLGEAWGYEFLDAIRMWLPF